MQKIKTVSYDSLSMVRRVCIIGGHLRGVACGRWAWSLGVTLPLCSVIGEDMGGRASFDKKIVLIYRNKLIQDNNKKFQLFQQNAILK